MNRKECYEILNNKDDPRYEQLHHIFYTNRNICRKYYNSLGYNGYVLHHINPFCDNYEEWKIDEIVPMTKEEHSRLHISIYKQGIGSDASQKKAHDKLRDMYASGELVIWNKGKKGVQVSVRKGKTGKDFPFLCASKKGKSGGWNKGVHGHPSLQHTDEQKQKQSHTMKEKSKSGDNDSFIYAVKGKIYVNNGIINKAINKDELNTYLLNGWSRGRIKGVVRRKRKNDVQE